MQGVYELASQAAFPNQPTKKVKPFSQELDGRRARLAGHILRAPNSDPLRQVSYQPDSAEPINIASVELDAPDSSGCLGLTKSSTIGPATQTMMGTLFKTITFYRQRDKE